MKKVFRKMFAVMSTMAIAFGSFINKIDVHEVKAADLSSVMTTTTIDAEEIADKMVAKFNAARAELGLESLYIAPDLNEAAEVRAKEIVELFDHTRPDGTLYLTSINMDKVDFDGAGEILLRGSANVDTAFNAWKNSTKHWGIITKPEATHIGIVAHFDPYSENRWYWAAEIVEMPEGVELEGQRLPQEEAPHTVDPQVQSLDDENNVPVESVIYGDINFDGIIDSFDLILITRHVNGSMELTDEQLEAADVITDGFVTEMDAAMLKMYILGKISAFPKI